MFSCVAWGANLGSGLNSTGGMKMSLPLESCIEVIVTLHFGMRSLSMVYLDSLVKRSNKPFVTP